MQLRYIKTGYEVFIAWLRRDAFAAKTGWDISGNIICFAVQGL